MSATFVTVLVGTLIGGALSGVLAASLLLTRPYRRALNRAVILLTQLLFCGAVVGALLLLGKMCRLLAVGRQSFLWSVVAFMIGLASGEIPTIRAEIKWRRSVGLDRGSRPA